MQETITMESGKIHLDEWRGLKMRRKKLTLGAFHGAIFDDNVAELVPMLEQQCHLMGHCIAYNDISR